MMRLKYVLTGVMLCIGLLAHGHPLHLTFSNLDFKTSSGKWVLTIKVFSDDFASALVKSGESADMMSMRQDNAEAEKILKNWLMNRMMIWFDSKPVPIDTWKFDGIKVHDDASWLTYSFTAPLPVSEIKIKNTLLLDLYSDQKNLFVFAMGRFQSAYEFKNKNQETTIKLNK